MPVPTHLTHFMFPRVVHVDRSPYDVYVGRNPKYGDPKWGNQFSHLPYSRALIRCATREESIIFNRKYILERPALIAAIKRELRGKTLGCHCFPLSCHGDTLLEIANEE